MNAISKIIDKCNWSRAYFSRALNIPYRTVEEWEADRRKPRRYVVDLINYRLGKIMYASTMYTILNLQVESVSSMDIKEIKEILKETSLSDAELLTKYAKSNREKNAQVYIKSQIWTVKENIIGEYKYNIYDDEMCRRLSTDGLEEAIRIAEEQFMLI